ncbi:transglutaminase-like domain-containing protein [Rubritalea sp.]|uniref:transglutaminase-like domain-containing protein n=1 Tax=Rubritalea sp. TaxID=2109375 RepID=UPI003EF9D559
MLKSDPKIIRPPWLLAGGALLFWGLSTGNLIVAIFLAILLEGCRFVKLRWDFDENAHVKAFQFSILLMALWVALSWIEDEGRAGSLNVIRWLPLIAFPVEFVQRYGKLDRMNLNAFFYFSRRRMNIDRKEGKEVHPIQVNSGYPYILGVLTAAASVKEGADYYWPILCLFIVLVLFSVLRQRGLRWVSSLWLIPGIMLLSWGLQWSMSTVYVWAKSRLEWGMLRSTSSGFLNDWHSHLSELGSVRLNPKIEWRLWSEKAPDYLRVASFNSYNDGRWTYNFKADGFESLDDAYLANPPIELDGEAGGVTYFRPEDSSLVLKDRTSDKVFIRGTITHNQVSTVVPTVGDFYAVSNMLGDDVYAEASPMGALRFVNREMLIDYTLWSNEEHQSLEGRPKNDLDLEESKSDADVIARLADELELKRGESSEEVIGRVVSHFSKNFEYGTEFDNGGYDGEQSQLEWFLTDLKKGHCEYFATATTLLLREAGIPARYCVGYAGVERGSDCWNVRGTNAHAWTRAYVNGRWMNVDATPPDWRGVTEEGVQLDPVEWLREQISLMREDFFMWRRDEANTQKLLFRGSILASLLILWIVFRLWRNRSRSLETYVYANSWSGETVRSPLLGLEKRAKIFIGGRKRGEPFGAWLSQLADLDFVDAELVERAIRCHQSLRFDNDGDESELKAIVKELKKQLRKR